MATYIEDSRYFNERAKNKVHCICGCSQALPTWRKITTCRWCGRTIYRDKKDEFMYKLNIQLKKGNYETSNKAINK